jgi:CheY-like chemotaxis protein
MTGRDTADHTAGVEGPAEPLSDFAKLVGELAHDLSNELMILQGWAQLARDEMEAGRSPAAEVDQVVELSDALGQMLRDAVSTASGAVLSPEVTFDPVALMEGAIARAIAPASGLTVRLRTRVGAPVRLHGHASFWSRLIGNLLGNCIRYARAEATVTLMRLDDTLILRLEDDGPGVQPADREAIFQPLWSGTRGGIGLGLSSAAWLVARLGGTIEYRSDSSLGGAAFEVSVPISARSIAPGGRVTSPDILRGLHLLVVDDDRSVRAALVKLLERVGSAPRQIDPLAAGDEIIAALVRPTPDAVLLDLRLPAGGGLAIWRKLHAESPSVAARTVFMSGAAKGDADWDEAASVGQPMLGKPFTLQQLAQAVAELPDTG